jgi:hypothetical protein
MDHNCPEERVKHICSANGKMDVPKSTYTTTLQKAIEQIQDLSHALGYFIGH